MDEEKPKKSFPKFNFGRIKPIERIILAKHLAIALKAGLDIVESFEVLAEQTSSKKLQRILLSIRDDIEQGGSLSDSFVRFSKDFPPLFIDLIYAGEKGGTLPENLEYLAEQLEKDDELKRKIKGAMIYPGIIFFSTIFLAIGLSVFILPKIVYLYESYGADLPMITSVLLKSMSFLSTYWLPGIIIGIILYAVYKLLIRVKKIRYTLDLVKIRMPLFGKLLYMSQISILTRTLGTLVRSGIPIQAAIESVSVTIDNAVYQKFLVETAKDVGAGNSLYSSLKKRPDLFPPLSTRIISMGEKTGNLEKNLLYLGDFYEKELDHFTRDLTSSLVPILLLFVGVVIGTVAVAIILPIYRLSGTLGRYK